MRVRYQRARWTYDVALAPWPIEEQSPGLAFAFVLGFSFCTAYIAGVASHIRESLLRRAATPSQDGSSSE